MASGDILVRVPNLPMDLSVSPGILQVTFNLNGAVTINSWPAGIPSTGTVVESSYIYFNFALSDTANTPAIGIDPTAKYTVTITQD